MSEPPAPPSAKFPVAHPPAPPLALPRRRNSTRAPFEVSDASVAARESIKSIVSATRSPFGGSTILGPEKSASLERSLRQLELSIVDREREVLEAESRISERERDLAETEALLSAREKLLEASRRTSPTQVVVSADEKAALQQLRETLEQQEVSLMEAKQALREREQFLDESEARLFEKVQAQQEKEIELEQREEDLAARQRRLFEAEAAIDPAAAARLQREDLALKSRDEFNE